MDKKRPGRFRYTLRYGIVAAVGIVIALNLLYPRESNVVTVGYGTFKQMLKSPGARFQHVRVGATSIRGEVVFDDRVSGLTDAAAGAPTVISFRTSRVGVQDDKELFATLDQYAPGYEAEGEKSSLTVLMEVITYLVLILLVVLICVLVARKYLGLGGQFGFGRGKHRLYEAGEKRMSFKDVAGIEEAKAELKEVVDFLQDSDKYKDLGGRIPKGVLLVGPPGTGKTLLAKSVAGEAGVPFFNISGSDFVEMFVGVGASRVRDLFREAAAQAPCIIFIDELDAMGRSRAGNSVASHEEREQTLNQLLVEMDGFDVNTGVILMAATNRPEILDPALLRPGRFDRQVVVDRPDIDGREAILRVHVVAVKKLSPDVNLRKIAALTPGSVGADLANIVNEAILLTARRGADQVSMRDFEEAIERGAVGLERKSRIMRPEEKNRVAVHEAGHALVACAVEHSDPVHKVSIIPRGLAGGYVLQRPDMDRMLMTRGELEARIMVALGGTIAEEIALGEISTGATSDLNTASRLATQMVREYGMSRLGRIYLSAPASAYLDSGHSELRGHSEQTAREVDLEVRAIIESCLHRVRDVLENGRPALSAVSQRLIEKEVLEDRELLELLDKNGFSISAAARKNLLEHHARQTPMIDQITTERIE
ncbi:MAG TPA: ATP-dependent zinc metalloprotease FtsH [Gemmataceae bacterium]|jgi:cell division protease FtsH|nr:ATP-dependent zinc metalloprotease FtsH [Gemmataceae bacterium]